MIRFNKFRRIPLLSALLLAAGALTLGSCTKVDDTLGSNLVPDNQQMKAGYMTLPAKGELNPRKYVETRLFQTDSIIGSNISYGYMGAMLDDTLGLRTAGFLTQYTSYYKVDSGYFGYRPIFDSAQLMLSISTWGGDTTLSQTFSVFEVTDNKYLTEKPISPGKTERDTTFYLSFNPETEGIVGDELFTFTLGGDQTGDKGPAATAVTLSPTGKGREYIEKLMLQRGKYKDDYSVYSADSLEQFVEEFKGLYIKPQKVPTEYGKGAVYATSLDASGLAVYGRNRVKEDPTLIKDTIGMVFYFYDSYATHGNVSLNHISHDYEKYNAGSPEAAGVHIDIDAAREPRGETDNRPLNPRVYVEGMGGVVTELRFRQEFFDALEAAIAEENASSHKEFTSMAFSQARMLIYFTDSDYAWENVQAGAADGNPLDIRRLIEEMDAGQSRLGLYTDYKKLTPVSDYAYTYEKNYGTTLSYGGYINRSRGCYILDITGHLQSVWNSYLKEKKAAAAEGRAPNLEKISGSKVYIGPEAYSLLTTAFSVLQGMPTDETSARRNNAPIRFELTYNMIK